MITRMLEIVDSKIGSRTQQAERQARTRLLGDFHPVGVLSAPGSRMDSLACPNRSFGPSSGEEPPVGKPEGLTAGERRVAPLSSESG